MWGVTCTIFYVHIHEQFSNTSTRSFLGLSLRSGSLKRIEHIPPFPSYLHTPAHLKETQKQDIESYVLFYHFFINKDFLREVS